MPFSSVEINGEALHASAGLPPALHVTKAKVGKLEITVMWNDVGFSAHSAFQKESNVVSDMALANGI